MTNEVMGIIQQAVGLIRKGKECGEGGGGGWGSGRACIGRHPHKLTLVLRPK